MYSGNWTVVPLPTGPLPVPAGFTVDETIYLAWVSTYAEVVSAALLTYDVFLTLEREYFLVWTWKRWRLPTFVYLVCRYGTWVQSCLNVITALDYQLDPTSCENWNLFQFWSIPAVMAVVEVSLTLRVLVLYSNDLRLSICLWLWYLLNTAVMFTMMGLSLQGSSPLPSPNPPTLGCQLWAGPGYFWQIYVPGLVYETTIAGLTLYKAVTSDRMLSKHPLFRVLIRDGFFYFFVVFALMLVNFVMNLTLNNLYFAWAPQISISLASIMAVRLFLNVRETGRRVATSPSELEGEESPKSEEDSSPWPSLKMNEGVEMGATQGAEVQNREHEGETPQP